MNLFFSILPNLACRRYKLDLEGSLDAEQREWRREIVDKGLFKRALGTEVLIETRTATK